MKIYDITLPISADIPYYPGDTVFSSKDICTIDRSGCNMLEITLGTHTGTHVDAPSHFLKNGQTVDQIDVKKFIGKVRLFSIESEKIDEKALAGLDLTGVKRVIFKTRNSLFVDKKDFRKKYVYLTFDGAKFLVSKGIKLIGIDYVSIERFGTPDFKVHKLLLENGVVILESLNLKEVNPGDYTLIALPLKIKGADGSPIRALLIDEKTLID